MSGMQRTSHGRNGGSPLIPGIGYGVH